jgi:hypothetical protein
MLQRLTRAVGPSGLAAALPRAMALNAFGDEFHYSNSLSHTYNVGDNGDSHRCFLSGIGRFTTNKPYVLFGTLVMVTLCACASSPPPSARPSTTLAVNAPPPSAGAQSESASSGAAAAAAVNTAAVTKPPYIAKLDKSARQQGYHVELSDGMRYYCRMHADLGTRIEQKECVSQDDFATVLNAQDQNRQLLGGGHICNGPGCSPH